jgi:hypothetical protein
MRSTTLTSIVLVALVTLTGASRAEALRYEPVASKLLPAGVKSALWARDCNGAAFDDNDCQKFEEGFTEGDSMRLTNALRARHYDEVWLSSGGGNLDEGILIADVFRRFQMTVRVPPGHSCVSACTVAFVGGAFRFVDQGATYEVHAASIFLHATADHPAIKMILAQPGDALKLWYEALLDGNSQIGLDGARQSAQQLMLNFQKALHPLGILPAGQEQQIVAQQRAMLRSSPRLTYPESPQYADDVARVKREGVPAAQEILMRFERDSMQQAIAELRAALPSLGSRAEPALKMLEAMYSSRITGTATLNHQTLVQMGYVTQLFDTTH